MSRHHRHQPAASEASSAHYCVSAAPRRLPPRARSAGLGASHHRSITDRNLCPARAHVWGKQAERSEAVGGSPGNVALRTGPDIPGGAQSILYTPFDLPSRVITGTGPSERLTTFDYTAD
ncbi:MAG TPA: hypothetical protein VJN18_35575, partial [Polyangiaceae bacterium]|nr:hypothetical protein [Polyangiaceae bacterium]